MGAKCKLPEKTVFESLYQLYSNKELAEMYGVSKSTINNHIHRTGVKRHLLEHIPTDVLPPTDILRILSKLYTDGEIAVAYNVPVRTVKYWREKVGINKFKKL